VIVLENGARREHTLDVFPDDNDGFDALKIMYPDARSIINDVVRHQWIVIIGEGA
jgi:hypothetical protein